ncbi:MAG: serine/threonine protein kinase, partial [Blastocatellia bacterium]|nr:serine/threonine protein kinase [Blastocatellia bacterium]
MKGWVLLNNRFELKEQFNQGGFGAIWLAEDLQNNRQQVVVKMLIEQNDPSTRKWIEKHFHDEAKALRNINHSGVVGLIDSGYTEDDKPFFVMEYVNGRTLRSEIDATEGLKGGFQRTARLIKQLGEAVTAAHKVGIYHRDLKPENIMLTEKNGEEVVKLIDFGIATVKQSYDETTKATLFAGSLCYMAPEQVFGEPKKESDIYALGVIAYEMVTGKTPFKPDKEGYTQQILQLVAMQKAGLQIKPKSLCPNLPKVAEQEIIKALSYKPQSRHKEAAEFGDKLSWALLEKPTVEKKTRYIRFAAIAVLILVLFLVISIVINFTKNGKVDTDIKPVHNIHSVGYWAVLQRYDNKQRPQGSPVRLNSITGQAYANKGDGITLHFVSEENGYVYVFNQSIKAQGKENSNIYSILFPTPNANNGKANLSAGKEISTVEGLFDGVSEVEEIWIIWTKEEDLQIQEIITQADQGEVKDS